MQLVPFDESWVGSQTKEDLKAWYRRPSVYGGFSVVGPLPLRRHMDWQRKGFEYITLGSAEDVVKVRGHLVAKAAEKGIIVDMPALAQSYDHMGNFRIDQYLKEQRVKEDSYINELQAKVDKFGAEAVIEMMRVQDPAFVLPASIKVPANDKPKGKSN